jgi:adenylosuccinate lyase
VAQTASTQWLERTLDDSAVRRVAIPQAFLTADAILTLLVNVTGGLVVYPKVIAAGIDAELPFMATEEILMEGVRQGLDRQDLHERIRQHSLAAAAAVKKEGRPNDLIERLARDPAFANIDLSRVLDPRGFVGRAPQQVDEFLAETVEPILAPFADVADAEADLKV